MNRIEAGKEYVVQVHCDEGVAIRIGPEPCVCVRKGVGEASAGECIGQPLSRESSLSWEPTLLTPWKAIWAASPSREVVRPGVVEDPGMCRHSLRGNREIPPVAAVAASAAVRTGKARSRSR